ncbi:helix-turn-helix transcriptional regulator [Streptococcus merionis]|uniref:AraC family transcriptional regulator n=1 Tax=Streptococcus merionis TaxID=400065 RepID=A0A239SUQ8_9STRE|nr:helix-turn-helix domain-containing protein [Streptococcus merionis]SNU89147.1 AraC family transcriptional regulator [Streptococcus merionis]
MPELHWKLPQFDVNIQELVVENFISLEEHFSPFEVPYKEAKHYEFKEIIKALNLSPDTEFALTSHRLDYPSQLHDHDYFEVVYLTKGRMLHIANRTTHVMPEGTLALIPPHISHLIAPIDSCDPTVINILISPCLMKKIAELLNKPTVDWDKSPIIMEKHWDSSNLKLTVIKLLESYFKAQYQVNLTSLGYLLALLDNFSENTSLIHQTDKLTQDCLQIIQKSCTTITQAQLAKQLNYSPGYLSRHIKTQTGQTISQHIAQAKLGLAQQLLLETDLSIRDIAEKAGYQSESHFHRVFKEKTAITPRQFRLLTKSKKRE